MNKPLTLIIKETKEKIATVCNESELPPVILDLIVKDLYSEIHAITEKQTMRDEISYKKSLSEDENIENIE